MHPRRILTTLLTTLLALLLCLPLSACGDTFLPSSQDITHVEMMRTLAVDMGENGLFSITASGGVRPGSQTSDSQPPVVLSANGTTIAGTCLTIRTAGDKNVSYSHVLECLIGERLARQGVEPVADYLERDYETRMNTKLFLVEGMEPGELIQEATTEQNAVTDRLEAIGRELPLKSEAWPYTLRNLLSDLADNGAALIPVVGLDTSGETPEISPEGLGWLKDGAYVDKLDRNLSQAACILTSHAESGMFEVESEDGGRAAVKLTDTDCTLTPVWEDGRLTGLNASIQVKADLSDLEGATLEGQGMALLTSLEDAVSAHLKRGAEEVIALSQQEGADFLHLQRELAVKSPSRKRALAENWDEWFPSLKVTVEVTTAIERSYDTNLV